PLERFNRLDALERGPPVVLGDQLLGDLPRHVAIDRGKTGADPVGRDVVEEDCEAGERADMRDAVAHLTGTDNADLANFELHAVRPITMDHRLSLSSSAASSGSAWNRSATRP